MPARPRRRHDQWGGRSSSCFSPSGGAHTRIALSEVCVTLRPRATGYSRPRSSGELTGRLNLSRRLPTMSLGRGRGHLSPPQWRLTGRRGQTPGPGPHKSSPRLAFSRFPRRSDLAQTFWVVGWRRDAMERGLNLKSDRCIFLASRAASELTAGAQAPQGGAFGVTRLVSPGIPSTDSPPYPPL
jgi:hypothetical protein